MTNKIPQEIEEKTKTPQQIKNEVEKEKTTRYYREELKRLRKEIISLKDYIRGMKDIAYYLGGTK